MHRMGLGFVALLLLVECAECGDLLRDRIRERVRGGEAARGALPDETFVAGATKVSVWHPREGREKRTPLVVFSHGYHGTPEQSRFLMEGLADRGYRVMAPRHADALGGGAGLQRMETGFGRPGEWSETDFADRAADVRAVLEAVRVDPEWKARVDPSRIALAGHSLGGYTVLGLAGGWPGWKVPGIRAVLALSPYLNPFVRKSTLGSLGVPVMYQTGTLDLGVAPFVAPEGMAFDLTSSPATLVVLERAGHFAWTDLNPRFHETIVDFSLVFLDRHLKDPARTAPWPRPRIVARFDEK